ncbi:hypothetical protein [Micromonospora sp. NPDC002575]
MTWPRPAASRADNAAVALDGSIDRVRRAHPDRPELWAALIHTGP